MVKFVAIWGIVALISAIAGGVVAVAKRRDHSFWAAWCFVFPPMLILLLIMPSNEGPRPRRPSIEDEDKAQV